jgi:hypothetical protein
VTIDTTALANQLRPVLLKLNRELRREIHSLGVTGGQVGLLVRSRRAPASACASWRRSSACPYRACPSSSRSSRMQGSSSALLSRGTSGGSASP